jgi:HK97 family phage major capsid protein
MEKRLQEIQARKLEIRSLLSGGSNVDLDAIKSELAGLEAETTSIEERSKIANSLNVGDVVGKTLFESRAKEKVDTGVVEREQLLASEEYRSSWLKDLKGDKLSEVEKRSISSASESGGAVIPTITLNKVIAKLKQVSIVFPLVSQLEIPSKVSIPFEKDNADASWLAQGTGSTPSSDTMGSLDLSSYKIMKTIEIDADVDAMSISAFESFIVDQLTNKIKMAVDASIISGNGTSQAKGILTAITPIETAETTGWEYDDICNLLAELPSSYAANGVLMMSRKTLYKQIAKIKDDNKQPIFVHSRTDANQPERLAGIEGKILGYPVKVYDKVPDNTIIFGDFQFYFFNWVKAFIIEKSREAGFLKGSTVYRALGQADGAPALEEAFVVQQLKESSV